MKNRFSLVLIISLVSCSYAFGDWKDNVNWAVDGINWPVKKLLKLRSAPLLREILHEKKGKFKSWHRVPKTMITAVLAYFTWKNEKVREVACKVTDPVKRAMGIKPKATKRKKDLKKRAEDWEKEEKEA